MNFSTVKPEVEYDLAGLDDTWRESEPEDKANSDDDSDSDVIPQLDGSVDEKPQGRFHK